MLHLITCHRRIMPRLAELLLLELSPCHMILARYYCDTGRVLLFRGCCFFFRFFFFFVVFFPGK